MPLSAVAGAIVRTTISSIFSKAVPSRDAGAALSVLDVLSSAIGIVAPIYFGQIFNYLGVHSQPLLSAVHYVLLLVLAQATVARDADEAPDKRKSA